jgi:hypothetical protein
MADIDETDEPRDEAGLTPAERRILKTKADRADQLEAELAAANLKLAAREANLNLNERQLATLAREHQGELTAEALEATAADLGWTTSATPPPPSDDLQAMGRIGQASAGGTPTGAPPPAADKLNDMLRQVKTMGNQQLATALPAAMDAIREAGLNFDSLQFGAAERIPDWGATS